MNPSKWPWRELPEPLVRLLWEAGLESPQEVNALTNEDLLEIEGIGPEQLDTLRQLFLGPTGPRSKHGDVLFPNPTGTGYMAPPGQPNRGGTGRPPNQLRAEFRKILDLAQEEQLRRLKEIAASIGPQMSNEELRRLMDTAAKYGIGSRHVVGLDREQIASLMRDLGAAVREHVLDASITSREEILQRIEEDWRRQAEAELGS